MQPNFADLLTKVGCDLVLHFLPRLICTDSNACMTNIFANFSPIVFYYIPINDTSFELSVFWLSDIQKPDQQTVVF